MNKKKRLALAVVKYNVFVLRDKPYAQNSLASAQSSPSRNVAESEILYTTIPAAHTGRQIPAPRCRTSHSNSTTPISTNASVSNIVPVPLQNGNRQGIYNSQQLSTQNNPQLLPSGRLADARISGAGAIPRRNMRRGNNLAEEEHRNDKQ